RSDAFLALARLALLSTPESLQPSLAFLARITGIAALARVAALAGIVYLAGITRAAGVGRADYGRSLAGLRQLAGGGCPRRRDGLPVWVAGHGTHRRGRQVRRWLGLSAGRGPGPKGSRLLTAEGGRPAMVIRARRRRGRGLPRL